MADDKKVLVSTLDGWYSALSKMYAALKTENATKYAADNLGDVVASSKLSEGSKATAEDINKLINKINRLDGRDADGNLDPNKNDLSVYFWYSDWTTPPGEITIGDTKWKIKKELRDDTNTTVDELKTICVNNSKIPYLDCNKGAAYSTDAGVYHSLNSKRCTNNSTTPNATITAYTQTVYSTTSNSRSSYCVYDAPTQVAVITSSNSNKSNTTTTSNSKTWSSYTKSTSYSQKQSNSTYNYSNYHTNCSQNAQYSSSYGKSLGNSDWHTNSNNTKTTTNATYTNTQTTGDSKTSNYSEKVVNSTSTNTKTIVETTSYTQCSTNATKTAYNESFNSTVTRNAVTTHSTTPSDSKDLSYAETSYAYTSYSTAPTCNRTIVNSTYIVGYSVEADGKGGYITYPGTATKNLDKYLYIADPAPNGYVAPTEVWVGGTPK